MTQYARILKDEDGEPEGAIVEVLTVTSAGDLEYKGQQEWEGCVFESGAGKHEILDSADGPSRPVSNYAPTGTGPAPVFTFEDVTRVTVVTTEGRVFEDYAAFEQGVELHLQDDGRTLKLFPVQFGGTHD